MYIALKRMFFRVWQEVGVPGVDFVHVDGRRPFRKQLNLSKGVLIVWTRVVAVEMERGGQVGQVLYLK